MNKNLGRSKLGPKINEMPSAHLYWRNMVSNAYINHIIPEKAIFFILPVGCIRNEGVA